VNNQVYLQIAQQGSLCMLPSLGSTCHVKLPFAFSGQRKREVIGTATRLADSRLHGRTYRHYLRLNSRDYIRNRLDGFTAAPAPASRR